MISSSAIIAVFFALQSEAAPDSLPVREVVVTLLYLVAAVMFIIGLRGLGSPRTARRGNQIAALGMLLAVVVTVGNLLDNPEAVWWTVGAGIVVGGRRQGGRSGAAETRKRCEGSL